MDRGEEAEECKMIHDITHHAYDVGDKNNGKCHGNAFCITAEQSRDQNANGNINKTYKNLTDEEANHVNDYTGNTHFSMEEPNDEASYCKENQTVNKVANQSANNFLYENTASADRKSIEKLNGAMAFFIG